MQPTVSWHRDEYDALGVPFGQRGEILDEQLEIWAKTWSGSPVAHEGNHYSFGKIWIEPQPVRPGEARPCGSAARACTRGSSRGWCATGAASTRSARPTTWAWRGWRPRWPPPGADPGELEYVGGTRGVFAGPDGVADLDRALAGIPAQLARGFTTICVKPSQFIDETARIGAFCRELAGKVSALRRLDSAVLTVRSFASVRSRQNQGGRDGHIRARVRAPWREGPVTPRCHRAVRRVHGPGLLLGLRDPAGGRGDQRVGQGRRASPRRSRC